MADRATTKRHLPGWTRDFGGRADWQQEVEGDDLCRWGHGRSMSSWTANRLWRPFSTTTTNMVPLSTTSTTPATPPTSAPVIRRPPPTLPQRSDPTYPAIIDLFSTLLPAEPHHLPLLYHTPRRTYQPITRLILSVTPTPGVYSQLTPTTAVFLHRPWQLERRRMHPSNLVLTSHQRLDELLTTGYNLALMDKLGLEVGPGRGELTGYKIDPERKMGVVARVPPTSITGESKSLPEWSKIIEDEFHGLEGTNFDDLEDPTSIVPKYIACMNAFEPTIIDRLLSILSPHPPGTTDPPSLWNDTPLEPDAAREIKPQEILYITGEPRPLGSDQAKSSGMPTIFIGHNRSEVWAIYWLAGKARERLGSGIEVIVVDEEEVVLPRPPKLESRGKQGEAGQGKTRKRKSSGDQESSSRQDKKEDEETVVRGTVVEDVTSETTRAV